MKEELKEQVINETVEIDWKSKVEELQKELTEVTKSNSELKDKLTQYEKEYKKLHARFNRLYQLLGTTIDKALNIDLED